MNDDLKSLNKESKTPPVFEFAEFSFDAAKKLLWRGAETVSLAPKACELLAVLIEHAPQVVSKDELMNQVWNDSFVEEANLTQHISALRKTLGEDKAGRKFIETIPRKGYRFVADVKNAARNAGAEIVISERTTEHVLETVEIEKSASGETDKIDQPERKFIRSSVAARQPSATRRSMILAAGVLLAALIGFAALVFYSPRGGASNRAVSGEPISLTRLTEGNSVGGTIISPDGKFVAYFQNFYAAGGGTIFLRQLETNREVQLLPSDKRTFGNMDFSPDGAQIYYVSFEKNAKNGAIYGIPILGGAPKRLVNLDSRSSFFAVSPDGKQIAFYRRDEEKETTALVIAALDGTSGDERILYSCPNGDFSFDGFLAWSPDSRFLTVDKTRNLDGTMSSQIYRMDLRTGETAALSDEKFDEIGKMVFRPDGGELFFIGYRNNLNQVYALDLASRQVRRVTNDGKNYGSYSLGISSDGKVLAANSFEIKADLSSAAMGNATDAQLIQRGETNARRGIAALPDDSIAYIARSAGNYDVWKIDSRGGNLQQLTNDSFQERGLTASRDGQRLVFSSDRAGGRHLFRMNAADGSDVKQLTFGETEDSQPEFSPDGAEIVYVSVQGEKTIVKKIPIEGGAPIILTDFPASNPVFSPDGSQIALKILTDSPLIHGKIAVIPANGGTPQRTFAVTDYEFFPVSVPIHWTSDGKAIVFQHETNGVGNLWQQNLDGSAPRQLTEFTSDSIYNFAYSINGSRFFLSRGFNQADPVLIKNF